MHKYYLISNSTHITQNMINELNKVILYYDKPGLIKETDILKIVSSPLDNNNFHFVCLIVYSIERLDLVVVLSILNNFDQIAELVL